MFSRGNYGVLHVATESWASKNGNIAVPIVHLKKVRKVQYNA